MEFTGYLKVIPKKWGGDSGSILEAARVLAEARKALPKSAYEKLRNELGISLRNDQRLRKIGSDKRLYDPKIADALPDSFSSLEKLSALTVDEFDKFKKSGRLKKTLTREEIDLFRNGKSVKTKQSWTDWNRLITIRVKGVIEPHDAQEIIDDISEAVYGINHIREMDKVTIEDHGLVDRINERNIKKMESDLSRDTKEALNWGRKICKHLADEGRRSAPGWLKKQIKLGQVSPPWTMDEVKHIRDFEGLKVAFSQLDVDDLDVDDLKNNPSLGAAYYKKLVN